MKKIYVLLILLTSFLFTAEAMNFSGTYYVGPAGSKPGGGDPDFLSIKACCDSISNGTITGNCIFYITGDLTETTSLALAVNPGTYTITFKPWTGLNPTITIIYATDANSGPSGAWVIGIKGNNNIAWADLTPTRNIIFDGSNTSGGTTKNLTITNATNSHRNAIPLLFVGDVASCTVKNCNVYYKAQGVSTSGNLFLAPIMVRSHLLSGVSYIPTNLTFENNNLSSNFPGVAQNLQGFGTYASTLPVDYPSGLVIKNNVIEGRRRALGLYRCGSASVYGNIIKTTEDIANDLTCEGIYAIDIDTGSTLNIYSNYIQSVVARDSVVATNGIAGISIESFGTYNIYNNFIYGFGLNILGTDPSAYIYGIKVTSSVATANIYFNSILMDSLNYSLGAGFLNYRGIYVSDGNNTVKNNIVYSGTVNFASYCIYRAGTAGTFVSDYNDFWAPGDSAFVGYFNTTPTQNLSDWKTASSQDMNSISANPGFISNVNLHLANNYVPVMGKGITIAGITKDIDDQNRDTPPEIGADEIPGVIPVELISFTAAVSGNQVLLNWSTGTETNNKGFAIQKNVNNNWIEIGFVNGKGTSTELQKYSFVDNPVQNGKMQYRIKQIDFDGSYSYSNVVEVEVAIPLEFALYQNYPNPFNPSTVIKYSIPVEGLVKLEVFNINGELVKTLVNESQVAGAHQVIFDASGLASGVYTYKLTSGNNVKVNKMNFIK